MSTKTTSKIIEAEILDSRLIYPMIAEYTLIQKRLSYNTYFTEPNYAMRTYAVLRQFMEMYCQVIASSTASPEEKKLASTLRIIDGFPVHDNNERGEIYDYFKFKDDNDLIDVPDQQEGIPVNATNNETDIFDQYTNEEPRRVFFSQEKIKGYWALLLPSTESYGILDTSSPIKQILHSFQHWVYATTADPTGTNAKIPRE
ncbi:hypothetical protein PtA15_18A328 [Puccinia triticina]|uniref:Uncharacterized protein n=1 Tax=Puccinia triticina TaxID=208348 RepID=A0ABY7D8N2_9BASI|nr:uncharacterized protein PtA15_18A328 [Puccinia triticina]WAQ93270.1 hypothetical protein PtA15_18A328 [Puccinia triticina]